MHLPVVKCNPLPPSFRDCTWRPLRLGRPLVDGVYDYPFSQTSNHSWGPTRIGRPKQPSLFSETPPPLRPTYNWASEVAFLGYTHHCSPTSDAPALFDFTSQWCVFLLSTHWRRHAPVFLVAHGSHRFIVYPVRVDSWSPPQAVCHLAWSPPQAGCHHRDTARFKFCS